MYIYKYIYILHYIFFQARRSRNKILSRKMYKNKQCPFSKDNCLISKVRSKSASSTAFFSTLASLRTWSGGWHQSKWDFALPTPPLELAISFRSGVEKQREQKSWTASSFFPSSEEKWRFNQDDGCNETQRDTKNLQNIPSIALCIQVKCWKRFVSFCSTSIIQQSSVSLQVNLVKTPKFNIVLFKKTHSETFTS